jgi:hypothetical protein
MSSSVWLRKFSIQIILHLRIYHEIDVKHFSGLLGPKKNPGGGFSPSPLALKKHLRIYKPAVLGLVLRQ